MAQVNDFRLGVRLFKRYQLTGVDDNPTSLSRVLYRLDSYPLAVNSRYCSYPERSCRPGVQLTERTVSPSHNLSRFKVEEKSRVHMVLLS